MKAENKPIHILTLSGGKWDRIYESARRVYSEDGISPTIHTCGGQYRNKGFNKERI